MFWEPLPFGDDKDRPPNAPPQIVIQGLMRKFREAKELDPLPVETQIIEEPQNAPSHEATYHGNNPVRCDQDWWPDQIGAR